MQHITNRSGLGAVAVIATLGLVLSACSSGTTTSGGTSSTPGGSGPASSFQGQTLNIWFPDNAPAETNLVTKTLVPQFEQQTGATVNVTFVEWGDLATKLSAAFVGNTAPDLFGDGPAVLGDLVSTDRLQDLTSYVSQLPQVDQDALKTNLAKGQYQGVQYMIPYNMQGNLIMYNAADFTAAGLDANNPPTTWEDLVADSQALTVKDGTSITKSGLLVDTSAGNGIQQTFTGLLYAAGGQMMSDDGKSVAFDSDQGVKALTLLRQMYANSDPAQSTKYANAAAAQQPLVTGDAAAANLGASAAMNTLSNAKAGTDLRVIPPLTFQGANSPVMFGQVNSGLVMSADSKVKDLAWAFMAWFISAPTAEQYTSGIGAIPARADAVDTAYVKDSPVMQAYLKYAGQFRGNPMVPGWNSAKGDLSKAIQSAVVPDASGNTVDPKTALDTAAAAVTKDLAAAA